MRTWNRQYITLFIIIGSGWVRIVRMSKYANTVDSVCMMKTMCVAFILRQTRENVSMHRIDVQSYALVICYVDINKLSARVCATCSLSPSEEVRVWCMYKEDFLQKKMSNGLQYCCWTWRKKLWCFVCTRFFAIGFSIKEQRAGFFPFS